MMNQIAEIVSRICAGRSLNQAEAQFLVSEETDLWEILAGANLIRRKFKGDTIGLCSIINAKSGDCAEDCKFCVQSLHHSTWLDSYSLVNAGTIKNGYEKAQQDGAHHFGIVTSGNELSDEEIDNICEVIKEISAGVRTDAPTLNPCLCASLGRLSPAQTEKLRAAGLEMSHHNLETSRRFFPQVCTTHSYNERVQTVGNLKKAGLRVCSGGIFGMGEAWQDRIDLAFMLRELEVDSVPLNFLIPIKGTALESISPLPPREALRIIALFRYILPDRNIKVCAGREKILRDLQSWIFYAGADGMMIGGYLTQMGRSVKEDLRMLQDLGLNPAKSRDWSGVEAEEMVYEKERDSVQN